MIAAGLGYFPDLKGMPTGMAVILTLFGAIVIYAGLYHGWLRIQRRRAYAGGRDRRGTARLLRPIGEDDSTAYILFANSHSEWLLTVDSSGIRKIANGLKDGLPARGYLGNDDRVYGLDIGQVKTLPISPGVPYEGKLRKSVEWAERKEAEITARKDR